MMNPEDLLPEDQYPLGADPEDHATPSKDRRQIWQAEIDTAVVAAGHATRQLNLHPECKHEDVQAAHFKPDPTRLCVFEAGRRCHKAKQKKRIMRWQRYNFLENREINSDSSDDESQRRDEPVTVETERVRRRQRQPNLNTWLRIDKS